jgi:hypothetical protein
MMTRNIRLLAWMPVTSMALVIIAMYSSWAVAYTQLGRRPQPNVDDPKLIGGLSTDLYEFCFPLVFVLLVIWFVTSILTCLIADSPKAERRDGWLVRLTAVLIAFGPFAFLFLLYASPGGAIGWFFD